MSRSGDAAVASESEMFDFDTAAFFSRYIDQARIQLNKAKCDAQQKANNTKTMRKRGMSRRKFIATHMIVGRLQGPGQPVPGRRAGQRRPGGGVEHEPARVWRDIVGHPHQGSQLGTGACTIFESR